MYERLSRLIKRAELDVIEFDCHTKNELKVMGRSLPFYVMSYLKNGEALLRMNGHEYAAPAGSIVLIPPNVLHDHIKISEGDAVFLWWHFMFTLSGSIDLLKLIRLPVVTHMNDTGLFENTFIQYLDALHKANSLPSLIYKNAKALEVLSYLFENILSSAGSDLNTDIPEVFLEILEDISKMPRADISLASFAEKYHMNATYISNRFKEYFGISPIFLNRTLLLERAKELLLSSQLSISAISDMLGFSDITVFTRFFTEKTGASPSKYRAS